MVIISVEILVEEHPELRRRTVKDLSTHAHYAMGRLWADQLLADHFKPGAQYAFGYAQRSAKYLRTKVRRARVDPSIEDGGRSPLVFRGVLRRAMARRHVVTATDRETVIELVGPKHFAIRYRAGRPNIAREVLAVNAAHERKLAEAAEAGFMRRYSELKPPIYRKRVR